jgi:hypothetical protein
MAKKFLAYKDIMEANKENIPPRPTSFPQRLVQQLENHLQKRDFLPVSMGSYDNDETGNGIILLPPRIDYPSETTQHNITPPSFILQMKDLSALEKQTVENVDTEVSIRAFTKNYTLGYFINQVMHWSNQKTSAMVNSLKINLELKPTPLVQIFKQNGSTGGQLIELNLLEIKQFLWVFPNAVIPSIQSAAIAGTYAQFGTQMNQKIPSRVTSIGFTFEDLYLYKIPKDQEFVPNKERLSGHVVRDKIVQQLQKFDFYSKGAFHIGSLAVHVNKMDYGR